MHKVIISQRAFVTCGMRPRAGIIKRPIVFVCVVFLSTYLEAEYMEVLRALSDGEVTPAQLNEWVAAGVDPRLMRDAPLRAAVAGSSTQIVRELLKMGADPNALDGVPVQLAAERGNVETMRVLLDAGASPNGGQGAAIKAAVAGGHLEAVRLLLKAGATQVRDAVTEAVRRDDRRIIPLLLAVSDATCHAGAIRCAINRQNLGMFNLLMKHGVNPRAGNDEALVAAATIGSTTLVRRLLKLGANARCQNDAPLLYAMRHGHRKVVKLLRRGAPPP